MRYIDHTNCKTAFERGTSKEVKKLGDFTKEAALKAETLGLGLLKTRFGAYKVIKKSGLGFHDEPFSNLKEANDFVLGL